MKVMLALALILILLLVGLPFAMGHMGLMEDCPACMSSKASFGLGLCAGILSFVALMVLVANDRLRIRAQASRQFLPASSIFKPPRPA